MKLIDKDALVAEIIRRRKAIPKEEDDKRLKAVYGNEAFVLTELLEYIDTLEVKEADIEKETNKYISDNFFGSETMGFFAVRTKEEPNDQDIELCAKHFFELGLKAQKGE